VRRTAITWFVPAVLIALSWLRLEAPKASSGRVAFVLLLALVPALVGPRRARIAATVLAAPLGAAAAFRVSPLAVRPFDGERFFGAILDRADAGLRSFYDLGLPFDPRLHEEMHGLVLVAVFGFALTLALAVRARRPLIACIAVAGGAGWPATLMGGPGELTRGGIILAICLFLLAALRPGGRAIRPALVAGGAVLVSAVAASATPAVARGGLLEWQTWNPYVQARRVSVEYVWRSQYRGIKFPNHPTTVFEVEAPDESRYWRATTLDVFGDDVWDESLRVISSVTADGRDDLTGDPTVTPAAADHRRWLRQRMVVKALRDEHLPAAATPVAYDADDAEPLYYAGGTALRAGGLRRGEAYTVWSYAPEPPAKRLAALGPDYPLSTDFSGYFTVWRDIAVQPFGSPGREAGVQTLMASTPAVARYQPLYRVARRVVGRAPTPYAAAVALETWFRSAGFTYDEQPPQTPGVPALVGFVTRTHAGYCQHYAGAMALMLRYLGVPARVAAGFTSGRWNRDRERWIVSDTDAHAWVEVWFPGYGWLPFDPTPARGTLDAPYTNASARFDPDAAVTALFGGGGLGLQALLKLQRERQRSGEGGGADAPAGASAATGSADDRSSGWLAVLVLASLGGVGLLGLGKWSRRRLRFLTRDPRRVATACRRELVELAADQRVDVPSTATPREAATLLHERLGVNADRLASAVAAARYGAPGDAEVAARRARRELIEVRTELRNRLTLLERLRGLLSLRSLRASA
jgi:transglutaminase superfamily protein/transglutaminase TgpA-like protein